MTPGEALAYAVGLILERVLRGLSKRITDRFGPRRATDDPLDDPYEVAAGGGKHSGFLNEYLKRSTPEIQRGVRNIERQIELHERAIRDPYSKIPNWDELDPRQQDALVHRKWPSDIRRQKEQLDILKGILRARGNDG